MIRWLIGVDEVGRGPLAGPVGVGVVLVPYDFDWGLIEGVGDSKKVLPENREAIFRQAKLLKQDQKLDFAVSLVGSRIIDKTGIVPSIQKAMGLSFKKVLPDLKTDNFSDFSVKLDGGLRAPSQFKIQETIIKGDGKEKVIGLASILAKVTRDNYMERLALKKEFEIYGFEKNKGYGTKKHRSMIADYGLSSEHRITFCKNILIL